MGEPEVVPVFTKQTNILSSFSFCLWNSFGRASRLSILLLALIACLICSASLYASPSHSTDVITDFRSFIYVNKDASLYVSESIEIYFGKGSHYGIARVIPLTEEINQQKHSFYVSVKSVSRDGITVPHLDFIENNNLRIAIVERGRELNGQHKYAITYNVKGAVREGESRPEIVWNVTGNQWPMSIERALAVVCPPKGVRPEDVGASSTISNGNSSPEGTFTRSTKTLSFAASDLAPGNSLTIAMQLPKGVVEFPTATNDLWWTLEQFSWLISNIMGPFFAWWLLPIIFAAGAAFWFFRQQRHGWNNIVGSSNSDLVSSSGASGNGRGHNR